MAVDNTQFQDIKARIESYKNLKKEFYNIDIDENQKIDEYIKLFQQFNDEFLDYQGEISVTVENITSLSSDDVNAFIALARSFVGHQYVWGAAGPNTFDCSGFVTYLMKQFNLIPDGIRFTVRTIPGQPYFYEVPFESRQPGDIICNNSLGHVIIYIGNGMKIHASNSNPYPIGGVKEDAFTWTSGRVFRIKGFGVE